MLSAVDIDSFFDSITEGQTRVIFSNLFRFSPDVSELLAKICTYCDFLPQGAPTSPAIANMIFFEQEPKMAHYFEGKGVRYTRFVDDIFISHPDRNTDLEFYRQRILRTIKSYGFLPNEKKGVRRRTNSLEITVMNVLVNHPQAKINRKEKSNIRAAVHDVEMRAKEPNARKSREYFRLWHRTSGRLNKLASVGDSDYPPLRARLRRIMPLLNDDDRKRLARSVRFFCNNHASFPSAAVAKKSGARLRNRLGLLGRTHPTLARRLSKRLTEALNAIPEDG